LKTFLLAFSASWRFVLRAATGFLLATILTACGSKAPPTAASPTVALIDGPRRDFEFTTIDGKSLSTASVAGRVTVIGFVATYDVASQAQARFLAIVLRRHVPRINAAILVLEPPENFPLAEAFVKTLDLRYPAALADAATIAGTGPFAGLHHVPSVVILDEEGHERFRYIGLAVDRVLTLAVRAVQERTQRSGTRE
jgi:hypothetical protein